jgi:RNA polymerase sigma-70 factor (ECF subfamily)
MENSVRGVSLLSRELGRVPADADAIDAALAASGDTRAFERLYLGHVARIHSLARRMAGTDAANELTQDVFVRAWTKLGTFRGEAAFGTWLHRLAINVILARRSARDLERNRFLDEEGSMEKMSSRPAHTDLRLDFEGAIAKLPKGARQVFVLHDVEGYKHEEIAEMMGIATGTSKAQLHRARMVLRQHLTA